MRTALVIHTTYGNLFDLRFRNVIFDLNLLEQPTSARDYCTCSRGIIVRVIKPREKETIIIMMMIMMIMIITVEGKRFLYRH